MKKSYVIRVLCDSMQDVQELEAKCKECEAHVSFCYNPVGLAKFLYEVICGDCESYRTILEWVENHE